MTLYRLLAAALALAALPCLPALANKDKDTLVWTGAMEPPNISAYGNNQREGVILAYHIWDGLLERDEMTGEFKPHLATSVTFTSPTEIDVQLRPGVKFHNGDPLTAEDVAWTINYMNSPESKSVNPSRTDWIKKAEATGPLTAKLHLTEPFAAAPAFLAIYVPIYPKAYYEKVGNDGFAKAPVGTGPYKATEVSPGKRIVLTRNPDYFGGAKGQPTIGTIVYRPIAEKNTQMAEFMTGGIDWIWQIEPGQAEKLKGRRGIVVTGGDTMRVGYLSFNVGKGEDHPVKKQAVRQAIAYAIDRESIVKNLKPPGATVVELACHPSQFGCEAPDAARYTFDPAKAKQLLAQAGYPDGFETEFYAYRDRPVAEAVINYLRAVGITAKLQWLQSAPLRDKARSGGVPINFGTWGSSSIPDVSAITSIYFKNTPDDRTLDPKVIAALEKGDGSIEPAERKKAYTEALTIIADQAYWVPLFADSHYYAYTDKLDFHPSPDEIPRFNEAKWK